MLIDLTNKLKTALSPNNVVPHWVAENQAYPIVTVTGGVVTHVEDLLGSAGVAQQRVQIDCWSYSLAQALTLAESVRNSLQGYKGTTGATEILFISCDSEQDMHEKPTDGSEDWLFRRSQDYLVKYRVSQPEN